MSKNFLKSICAAFIIAVSIFTFSTNSFAENKNDSLITMSEAYTYIGNDIAPKKGQTDRYYYDYFYSNDSYSYSDDLTMNMTTVAAIDTIFRTYNLESYPAKAYDSEKYDNTSRFLDNFYTAIENDLLPSDALPNTLMTKDTFYSIINTVKSQDFSIKEPEILSKIKSQITEIQRYGDTLKYLTSLPQEIVDNFFETGWKISFNTQKLRDYETSYSTDSSVSGLYSPSDKTIFVDREGTIPHEMGHYIYFLLERKTNIRGNVKKLFDEEAANAEFVLGSYSGTSSVEYFAEAFAAYYKSDMPQVPTNINYGNLQLYAPKTYGYIKNLDASNWLLPASENNG